MFTFVSRVIVKCRPLPYLKKTFELTLLLDDANVIIPAGSGKVSDVLPAYASSAFWIGCHMALFKTQFEGGHWNREASADSLFAKFVPPRATNLESVEKIRSDDRQSEAHLNYIFALCEVRHPSYVSRGEVPDSSGNSIMGSRMRSIEVKAQSLRVAYAPAHANRFLQIIRTAYPIGQKKANSQLKKEGDTSFTVFRVSCDDVSLRLYESIPLDASDAFYRSNFPIKAGVKYPCSLRVLPITDIESSDCVLVVNASNGVLATLSVEMQSMRILALDETETPCYAAVVTSKQRSEHNSSACFSARCQLSADGMSASIAGKLAGIFVAAEHIPALVNIGNSINGYSSLSRSQKLKEKLSSAQRALTIRFDATNVHFGISPRDSDDSKSIVACVGTAAVYSNGAVVISNDIRGSMSIELTQVDLKQISPKPFNAGFTIVRDDQLKISNVNIDSFGANAQGEIIDTICQCMKRLGVASSPENVRRAASSNIIANLRKLGVGLQSIEGRANAGKAAFIALQRAWMDAIEAFVNTTSSAQQHASVPRRVRPEGVETTVANLSLLKPPKF